MANLHKLIVDCDPGHDDAIALLFAHAHTEVVGITTVSGNTSIDHTTANALSVCALLGVETPVFRGAAKPLLRQPEYAGKVHGPTGLGDVELPHHQRVEEQTAARDFLLDAVDTDTWVAAIGPLTNIAQVLEIDPDWGDRIAGLSIMGGSATFGNVTSVAEFNIYHDPEAAEIVFNSETAIKMCGLNLTTQFTTDGSTVDNVRRQISSNNSLSHLAKFAADSFSDIHDRMEAMGRPRRAALHDPCAILAITHPHLIGFHPRSVQVETKGTHTTGMTVVDERLGSSATDALVEVGYVIDVEKAMSEVLEVVGVSSS